MVSRKPRHGPSLDSGQDLTLSSSSSSSSSSSLPASTKSSGRCLRLWHHVPAAQSDSRPSSGRSQPLGQVSEYMMYFALMSVRMWLKQPWILTAVAILVVCSSGGEATVFKDCGGVLQGPVGTIQSPNFPGPFSVPIVCRWVIQAPKDRPSKIVIYFTQYFLKHSFYITEYDHYESSQVYYNANPLGEINAQDLFTSVVAYRPYVILDLKVTDSSNVNLRVEEFLRDVHGFNITYMVVDSDRVLNVDTCSVHQCSYLGNCLASADYGSYSCQCFNGFYGNHCEKGPHCDPDKGKNMCLHGGQCRYFYGSLVNICECPPEYNGAKCENRIEDTSKEECLALACSQHCQRTEDGVTVKCVCDKGFRLKEDGRSCVEEEFYRVWTNVPVRKQANVKNNLLEFLDNLEANIYRMTTIFQLSGLSTLRDLNIDHLSNISVQFHFYIEKIEYVMVAQAVQNLARNNLFFGILIDSSNITFGKNPEMKLLSVENPDEGPALEGKLMTLTCTARGSNNLQFRWFKDGKAFNMTLTNRNAWEIRLPETISEKRISVLNIDGVTTYDQGEFTCAIQDFGLSMNRSVLLDVLPYPQVEVTPLTISATEGSSQSFRCLSPDENQSTFNYSWTKNNRPINDVDEEVVEDLLPSGSRLVITKAKVSTNYTCRVTNKAGTSSRTVYVFVVDANSSALACASNNTEDVKWNRTFGGYFNLHKCPTDAAGYALRRCECQAHTCQWRRPNYARCQSVHLIEIYDQLMKIQLGYQDNQLMDIYRKLYQIARQARGRMFAGDLDITAKNLHTIVTVARDFPSLCNSVFEIQELIDFLSILLEETSNMTGDEKLELRVGGRLLQVTEVMVEMARSNLLHVRTANASAIALTLTKALPLDQRYDEKQRTKRSNETNDSRNSQSKRKVEKRRSKDEGTGTSDTNQQTLLTVKYDQRILPLLEKGGRSRNPQELLISDVFSFLPMNTAWVKKPELFLIDIPHRAYSTKNLHLRNTTYCYSWERKKRDYTEGEWKHKSCTVKETSANRTRCLCPLPGHFTVIVVPAEEEVVVTKETPSHLTLLWACIVSLTCLVLLLCSYLVAWRCLSHEKHNIHFNFIVSVTGINFICFLCLTNSDKELMCIAGKLLLQLFTVAAFTFLLLDAMQLFAEIHARMRTRLINGCFKFVVIGWSVPALSVVCAILMMEMTNYDDKCGPWCWWERGKYHFYSVIIPVILLTVGHNIVLIICIFHVTKWNDEWRFRDRRKSFLEIGRSQLLLALLLVFVMVGATYEDDKDSARQILFMLFDFLLVAAMFVVLAVFIRPIRYSVQSLFLSSKLPLRKRAFSNFQGNQNEQALAEVERIHEFRDRVDRERFTSEYKRQLRFLLNSSSSSGSSGVGSSSPRREKRSLGNVPNGTQSQLSQRLAESAKPVKRSAAKTRREKVQEAHVDSGISEGTESEKSSTTRPESQDHDQRKGDGDRSQLALPSQRSKNAGIGAFRTESSSSSSSTGSSLSTPRRHVSTAHSYKTAGAIPKRRMVVHVDVEDKADAEDTETTALTSDISEQVTATAKTDSLFNEDEESSSNSLGQKL